MGADGTRFNHTICNCHRRIHFVKRICQIFLIHSTFLFCVLGQICLFYVVSKKMSAKRNSFRISNLCLFTYCGDEAWPLLKPCFSAMSFCFLDEANNFSNFLRRISSSWVKTKLSLSFFDEFDWSKSFSIAC